MTTIKLKYLLYVVLLGFMATSCTSMLEEDASHVGTGETFYKTPEGLESAINACYASLRPVQLNKWGILLLGTDVVGGVDSPSSTAVLTGINEYGADLDENNGDVYGMWANLYVGINMCNWAIISAPEVKGIDPAKQKKRYAEALFIRTLYYYYLVELWGDVPFLTTPSLDVITTATRTPEKDIYESLINDLTAVAEDLDVIEEQWGRVTRGAAYTLLSKLYLTRGYKTYGNADDFKNAAKYADDVIFNMGNKYTLLTGKDGYASLFFYNQGTFINDKGLYPKRPNNEKNKEMIFSVQFHDQVNGGWYGDNSTTKWGNNAHARFSGYPEVPGNDNRGVKYGRHIGGLGETPFLYNLFGFDPTYQKYDKYSVSDTTIRYIFSGDYTVDKRFDATFERMILASAKADNKKLRLAGRAGAINRLTHNMTLSVGDTCLFVAIPGQEVPQSRIDAVPYIVVNPDKWFKKSSYGPTDGALTKADSTSQYNSARPFFCKFNEEGMYDDQQGKRDLNIFRLGEVYLIAAEAYLHFDKSKSLERVNAIRRRASGAASLAAPSVMDITENILNLDFILDERARELFGEEPRWLELKRTGKLVERVLRCNVQAGHNNAKFIKEYHNYRPIPYQWWIRLTNRDQVKRNEGYF